MSHFKKLLNDQADTTFCELPRSIPFVTGWRDHPLSRILTKPWNAWDLAKPLDPTTPHWSSSHTAAQSWGTVSCSSYWKYKTLLSDFRDATIITIFKKGDRGNCNNYRGISLLSIASKIFARILLDRLLVLAEDVLPESQCGFRPSRGTIVCVRQLQEKSPEQQQPVMFIFWDLKRAFDKVPRPAMWAVLARFGYPPDFVTLMRDLHDGMVGRVRHQNSLSEPFPIKGGMKHVVFWIQRVSPFTQQRCLMRCHRTHLQSISVSAWIGEFSTWHDSAPELRPPHVRCETTTLPQVRLHRTFSTLATKWFIPFLMVLALKWT